MAEYSVSTVSDEVEAMLAASQAVVDIDLGGDNMRAQGVKYLPQFPQESDKAYDARRLSSWLFNGVGKTLEDTASKVFAKPVALGNADGNPLAEYMGNVDLEGRDLNSFASEVFKAGIKRGISFIMVDAPRRDREYLVGEARAMNLRPSMTHIPLESVLGWAWQNVNNEPTLTQFRIMETVADPDRTEFSNETVGQIRVLDLVDGRVQVRIYQADEDSKDASAYALIDAYPTGQTEIMVVPFYTDRTGFLRAAPPLDDLVEINLAHWRSQSDQANIMHHARAPMKFFHGYTADDLESFTEGSGYAFVNSDVNAKAGVIEHGGAAIEAGRNELKDMEFQMQVMGLQLVISKTGNNTATGDSIDESKANSRLGMWADSLKDALETAMGWMADLANTANADTEVFVNKEYAALGHLTMDQVRDMYVNNVISQRTYIAEAKRRGVLGEDVSADDEKEYIEDEGGAFVGVDADPV